MVTRYASPPVDIRTLTTVAGGYSSYFILVPKHNRFSTLIGYGNTSARLLYDYGQEWVLAFDLSTDVRSALGTGLYSPPATLLKTIARHQRLFWRTTRATLLQEDLQGWILMFEPSTDLKEATNAGLYSSHSVMGN